MRKLHFLNARCSNATTKTPPNLSKCELKQLLSLAQSDRERECIRFAAYKASGLSATGARKHWGMVNEAQRVKQISECIEETRDIRMCVDDLAESQSRLLMALTRVHQPG